MSSIGKGWKDGVFLIWNVVSGMWNYSIACGDVIPIAL